MGAEESKPVDIQDTINDMKRTAKGWEKESQHCVGQQKKFEAEALKAVQAGNMVRAAPLFPFPRCPAWAHNPLRLPTN